MQILLKPVTGPNFGNLKNRHVKYINGVAKLNCEELVTNLQTICSLFAIRKCQKLTGTNIWQKN